MTLSDGNRVLLSCGHASLLMKQYLLLQIGKFGLYDKKFCMLECFLEFSKGVLRWRFARERGVTS